jgi:hypothetical protein
MRKICFVLFFITCLSAFSQEKHRKEFIIVTDNDLYVSTEKDRYYTNGLFLSYRHIAKTNNEKLEKKIHEWSLNHEMYAPFVAIIQGSSLHDRPFAANLFGSFGIDYVYKTDKIIKTSVEFGVIGTAAFGRELQDFIHDIYGFRKAVGWDYQIKNALLLNFQADYINDLITSKDGFYDISSHSNVRFGTIYTDATAGALLRIGFRKLQPLKNSIAYRTSINNESTSFVRVPESFLYIKPMIQYALYDATIQGSFLNTGSPVTKTLVPFRFSVEVGLKFTMNRVNFGYNINFQTKKLNGLRFPDGHTYGSISLSYLID